MAAIVVIALTSLSLCIIATPQIIKKQKMSKEKKMIAARKKDEYKEMVYIKGTGFMEEENKQLIEDDFENRD